MAHTVQNVLHVLIAQFFRFLLRELAPIAVHSEGKVKVLALVAVPVPGAFNKWFFLLRGIFGGSGGNGRGGVGGAIPIILSDRGGGRD